MNENNKQVQIQIQLPRITRILFDAKQILEKKNLSLDLGDNPIYPDLKITWKKIWDMTLII